MTRIL